jgi:hypothetical protein
MNRIIFDASAGLDQLKAAPEFKYTGASTASKL